MSTPDLEPGAGSRVDAPAAAPEEAPSAEPERFEEEPLGGAGEVSALGGQMGAPVGMPGRRKKVGIIYWLALAWLAIVVIAAITANWLPIDDPNHIDVTDRIARPGHHGHILGADGLGRDILARLIFGARVSLIISVVSVTIGMAAGLTIGMVVGYFRGLLETVVIAALDIFLAFPPLILLLGLVAFRGQSLSTITVVIGILSIPVYTRVARAVTLAVAQREYVLAAKAMGAKHRRILFREIMPNVVLPVLALGLVSLGVIIVVEGTLAFLNLSVQRPTATWGSMIAEGKRHLNTTVHVALIPSIAMFLTVLSINFVGDRVRSRFDVRESAL